MKTTKDIQENLHAVLKGGDILLIIPPFAIRDYAILAPHLLQTIARQLGYKTEILYANILFAALLGEETYDKVSKFAYDLRWLMIGERLFARSAYGLPKLGKALQLNVTETNTTERIWRPQKESYPAEEFDHARIMEIEELCFLYMQTLIAVLAEMPYKIIGCTSTLEQNNSSVAILKGVKKLRPDIITIIGGRNCEGDMAEGIASLSPDIDYIFSGESDISFKVFLQNYAQGQLPGQRIIYGEALEDLDSEALADYDSYFKQTQLFLGQGKHRLQVASYETSRGCWRAQKAQCFFCGGIINNHHFRTKSEEKVITDWEAIAEKYPVTHIMMTDNIVPHFYFEKLMARIQNKEKFPAIWYQENTNLSLKDLINRRKININSLVLGLESVSTGLLKLMNKGVTARQNVLLLRNACSVGIQTTWYFIWGFPGDKVQYYHETIQILPLMRHLPPPNELVFLKLSRFSPYLTNPQRFSITNIQPVQIYQQIYPDNADIYHLAYYFSGEYPCESLEHPEVIEAMAHEIALWKQLHDKAVLTMIPFANYYIIKDTREIPGTVKNHVVDAERAREIMRYCRYTASENQNWAITNKLGVLLDSWYVPLITAAAELLLTFEEET